jgi:hypothetical protein
MSRLILLKGKLAALMDSYLRQLRGAISSATHDMTAEQMRFRREGKWSVSEILEHLYLTYTGTIKGLGRCVASGKPFVSSPSTKMRLSRWVVVNLGYMPGGRQAPDMTRPTGNAGEGIAREIISKLEEMEFMLARAEEKFGGGTYVLNHPVLGPLTAKQWSKFHWVHGMHHVKQIEDLLDTSKAERKSSHPGPLSS